MMTTTKDHHAMRGGAIILDRWHDYGLTEPSVIKPILWSEPVEDVTFVGKVDEEIKGKIRESLAYIFGGRVTKKTSPTSPALLS